MDWIECESFGLDCPLFADELVGREALEGLPAAAVVVVFDEVAEVPAELVEIIVVKALDGGVLDGPVHALDLPVGPGVVDFGEAVLDAMLAAAQVEHVGHLSRRGTFGVARRMAELDAVVGQHGVDRVGHGLDQGDQESRGGDAVGLLDQLSKGKLGRLVNGHKHMQLALGRAHLGDVDMDITDRIAFERLLGRLVTIDIGQPGDAMPLKTAVQ